MRAIPLKLQILFHRIKFHFNCCRLLYNDDLNRQMIIPSSLLFYKSFVWISRKMASNGCLGEPVARVTRSAMKRKFTTTVDEPHKYKQKTARDSNDESSKLIENSLLGNSIDTKKSLNAAADTGENGIFFF